MHGSDLCRGREGFYPQEIHRPLVPVSRGHFHIREGLPALAGLIVEHPPVEIGLDVRGVNLDYTAETRDGVFQALGPQVHKPQVKVGHGAAGVNFGGGLEVLYRLLVVLGVQVDPPAVYVAVLDAGTQLYEHRKIPYRLLVVPKLPVGKPPLVVGVRACGVQRDCPVVVADCVFDPLEIHLRLLQAPGGPFVFGVQLKRPSEILYGLAEGLEVPVGSAAVIICGLVLRVKLNGPRKGLDSGRVPAV